MRVRAGWSLLLLLLGGRWGGDGGRMAGERGDGERGCVLEEMEESVRGE